MTEKEFDDIFKSLRDYTETPSEDTWKGIEKKMDRRRNSVMLRWIGAVSAAAAIIVGILLAVPHESAYAPDGVRIISGEDMTAETLDGKSGPGMSEPGKSGPGKPDFSQATAPACQAPEGTAEPAYIEPELPESNAETGKPVPESESGMQQHQSRQPQRTESGDDWSEGSNWRDINQQTGRTRKYTAAVLDLSTTAQAGTLAGSFTSPAEARYIRTIDSIKEDDGIYSLIVKQPLAYNSLKNAEKDIAKAIAAATGESYRIKLRLEGGTAQDDDDFSPEMRKLKAFFGRTL